MSEYSIAIGSYGEVACVGITPPLPEDLRSQIIDELPTDRMDVIGGEMLREVCPTYGKKYSEITLLPRTKYETRELANKLGCLVARHGGCTCIEINFDREELALGSHLFGGESLLPD